MDKMIDGVSIAQDIQKQVANDIRENGLKPGLAVVLVGDDAPSHLYVSKKKKASKEVGIDFHLYLMEADSSQKKILEVIDFLNKDDQVDAILVQLPLPKHLDTDSIIKAIDPKKDVDGFHPENIKDFLADKALITPGLPLGVLRILEHTKEELTNKTALIVSKSDVFSKPMTKILTDRQVKVTTARPDDPELKNKCLASDILIVSCGKPFIIKGDMIKLDSIIIDIGTNKIDNSYVVGDVDYSAAYNKAKFITPVPGGVGPITVAMLLYNTLQLALKH